MICSPLRPGHGAQIAHRRTSPFAAGPGKLLHPAEQLRACCFCPGVRCSQVSIRFSMRCCCCGGRLEKCCSRCRNICCRSGGKRRNAGIALQRALLFAGRQALISPQPVTGMPLPRRMRLMTGGPLQGGNYYAAHEPGRERHNGRHGQHGRRHPSRHKISQPHSLRPRIRLPHCRRFVLRSYGFATTSCCTSRSSSKSKSEYRS